MSPKKKSGGSVGIVEALWAGTAVFAATKSKTYSGFITSVVIYGLILIVVLAVATWFMKTIGLRPLEKFSVEEIQCQAGETPTADCYGEKGCTKPSGACYKLLNTSTGPASA
jgi:hypothetical protein